MNCPCGDRAAFADCCGRFHAGAAAPTAEALMRSRYSAFVLGDADYLLATWHSSTRPERDALRINPAVRWLGLEVKCASEDGDAATVEFIARSKRGGSPAERLHETSQFLREDGRWFYVDGVFS